MYYTGIGSRQTPAPVLATMTAIACHLASEGYTLRSGGAAGADTAFEAGAGAANEIYLPGWGEFAKLGQSTKSKGRSDLNAAWDRARAIAQRIHPAWHRLGGYGRVLHIRNVFQVTGPLLDKPSAFVVFWAPEANGQVYGGTRTAVVYARELGIPTFNLLHGTQAFKAHLQSITEETRR